ncbi:NAD(+) diphosphatase [Xanthomonas fragariae]|uniref:NAD(+) diphosphatase n=2 Tax=Xanthomonas fragariae TaxID=48664 RepID=A0A1Y6H320_9XANT|nr:NAD(+) diphosphatase [Xanthomonas fragariae]AOD16696.1 NADH pyrophosphatase [Xanthomonas fragariae]AOD20103.1 NADH pyrophosphatase [Xanthomonas fragariae]ENZ96084.1 NUDIX hydrolase [Xanthomonas fragariae LMG 25863]MBL9197380.1 NAD(+) diphosphatase [Xanthomonas fragariae]MBL9223058.1 NAD(+) diphosphatase [Xanthomonas fragariae]
MSESLFSSSDFAFTHAPLDRGDLLRDDPDALARLLQRGRVLLLDAKGTALADADGQPLLMDGAALGAGSDSAIFLGLRNDVGWFCLPADIVGVQAPQRIDLRQVAADCPADIATAFAYARAMLHWQSRTRFCGVCGGAIAFRRAGFIAQCTQCQSEHYPRVDPAIIVAVSDGERLLLGRQARWAPGRYSVIAGFVEPGESLEQAVAREVFEETRVHVQDCRYQGAQPWPFPGALMLGFTARAAAAEMPQVTGELEDARWVSHAEVTAALAGEGDIDLPPRISIACALIEHWHRSHG